MANGQTEFILSEADLKQAGRAHYRTLLVRPRNLTINASCVLVVAVFTWLNGSAYGEPGRSISAAIAGLIAAAVIALVNALTIWVWIPMATRRQFRQQKGLRQKFQYSWDAASLRCGTAQGHYSHIWRDFYAYQDSGRRLLLYISSNLYLPIPLRTLAPGEHESLVALLRDAKVPERRRAKG